MNLSLIVAVAQNGGIGLHNKLLWHLPADLQFFKQTTLNSAVIMGRKTFESIGKALPKRKNIVLSSDKNYLAPGCTVVNNIDDALAEANSDEIFIIGGAALFEQTILRAHKLYVTEVHHNFEADTFFPKISLEIWKETSREFHQKDEKNSYDYSFVTYQRRSL